LGAAGLDGSAISTDEDFDDMQSYDSIIANRKAFSRGGRKKTAKSAEKSWLLRQRVGYLRHLRIPSSRR
jgi:hypothetical protein